MMSQQKILIIEDEKLIADWLKTYFEKADYAVQMAYDGRKGLQMARELSPDLIILDLGLPSIDGISICDQLRTESDVPIIMLTAKGSNNDRIKGLEHGADDYIVKPFDPKEVLARTKAVLRRVQGKVQKSIVCGDLTLDERKQTVSLNGTRLALSQAQFELLATFMRHSNQVLSRDQLISLAFKNSYDGFDRSIDAHIKRLRKLIHTEAFQPIQTVYGSGYRFEAPN